MLETPVKRRRIETFSSNSAIQALNVTEASICPQWLQKQMLLHFSISARLNLDQESKQASWQLVDAYLRQSPALSVGANQVSI